MVAAILLALRDGPPPPRLTLSDVRRVHLHGDRADWGRRRPPLLCDGPRPLGAVGLRCRGVLATLTLRGVCGQGFGPRPNGRRPKDQHTSRSPDR